MGPPAHPDEFGVTTLPHGTPASPHISHISPHCAASPHCWAMCPLLPAPGQSRVPQEARFLCLLPSSAQILYLCVALPPSLPSLPV